MKHVNQINFGLVLVAAAIVVYSFSLTFWSSDAATVRLELSEVESVPPGDTKSSDAAESTVPQQGNLQTEGRPSTPDPRLLRNRTLPPEQEAAGQFLDESDKPSGADDPDPAGFSADSEGDFQESLSLGDADEPSRSRPVTRRVQPLRVGNPPRRNDEDFGDSSLVIERPSRPLAAGGDSEPPSGLDPESPSAVDPVEPLEPPPSPPQGRRQSPPPPPTRSSMP